MSEQSEPRKSPIPEFSNIEEEAEFWDTHDTTEFEDEFKPVQVLQPWSAPGGPHDVSFHN